MRMFAWILLLGIFTCAQPSVGAQYERNKAVPVAKVLFGSVTSIRQITEQEVITDKANGWEVFGGALIGGLIGSQFGGGDGQTAATILGALIGGNAVNKDETYVKTRKLVEMMILSDSEGEFMVVQDYDSTMIFHVGDTIRMVYFDNGTVRIDKQM